MKLVLAALIFVSLQRESIQNIYDYNRPSIYGTTHPRQSPAAPAPAPAPAYPAVYTMDVPVIYTNSEGKLVTGTKSVLVTDYSSGPKNGGVAVTATDYAGASNPEYRRPTSDYYGGVRMPENGISTPGYGIPTPGYGISNPGYGISNPGYGISTSGYGISTSGYGNPMSGYGNSMPGFGNSTPGYGNSLTPADNSGAKPVHESLLQNNDDDAWYSTLGHVNKTPSYSNSLTPADNNGAMPVHESLSQNNDGGARRSKVGHANRTSSYRNNLTPADNSGARHSKVGHSNRTTDYGNSLTPADNSGANPAHESLSQNSRGGARHSRVGHANRTPPVSQGLPRSKSRTAPHNRHRSSSRRTKPPVSRSKSRNSGSGMTVHPLLAKIKDENVPLDLDLSDNESDTVVHSSLPNTNRPNTPVGPDWSADNESDTVVHSSLVNTNRANTPIGRSLSRHIESSTTPYREEITITPSYTSLFKPADNQEPAVHQGSSTDEESSSHVLNFLSMDDKSVTPVRNEIPKTLPDKSTGVQEYSNTPSVMDHHWNPNTLESLFQKMKSLAEQTSNDSLEPPGTVITTSSVVIDDSNPAIYKRRIVRKSTSLQRSATV